MMEHIKTRLLPYDSDEIFGRWAYRCGEIEEVSKAMPNKNAESQVDLWSEGTTYRVAKHQLTRNAVLTQMATDMADGTMPYVFKNIHSLRVEPIYVPYINLHNRILVTLNSTIMTVDGGKFFKLPANTITDAAKTEVFNPMVVGDDKKILGMNISRHDTELYANDLGVVVASRAEVVMIPMWHVSFVAYDGAHSFFMVDGPANKETRAMSPAMPKDAKLTFKPYGEFKLFRVIVPILPYLITLGVFIVSMIDLPEIAAERELPQETIALVFAIGIVPVGILFCYASYPVGYVIDRIYTFFKRIQTKNRWKRYCNNSSRQKQQEALNSFGVKIQS